MHKLTLSIIKKVLFIDMISSNALTLGYMVLTEKDIKDIFFKRKEKDDLFLRKLPPLSHSQTLNDLLH